MCAILGVHDRADAVRFVENGLRRLSYRGHDSHGWVFRQGNDYLVHRSLGAFRDMPASLHQAGPRRAVAHTRWATHGEVSLANCHPVEGGRTIHGILDTTAYVVHNGTITNFASAREWLSDWYEFRTDTDTEVVAHYLDALRGRERPGEFLRAVLERLSGQYALAAFSRAFPDLTFLAARQAPLLVTREGYFASDANGLAGFASVFARLPDGWYGFYGDTLHLFDPEGHEQSPDDLTWCSLAGLAREDGRPGQVFSHHSQKEIHEQVGYLREQEIRPPMPREGIVPTRVTLIGCGSSYYAGCLGRRFIESIAGIPARVEYATELVERQPAELFELHREHLWLALSQSGETRDTIGAVENIRACRPARGSPIWCVTTRADSTLAGLCGRVVELTCGAELGVAATKTFTATLVEFVRLCLSWCEEPNWPGRFWLTVSEAVDMIIENQPCPFLLTDRSHLLVLGRNLLWPVAQEGALKIKEVACLHAEAVHAAEVKHGPLALVDADMPCLFLVGQDDHKVVTNIRQVLARKGDVYAIATEGVSLPLEDHHVWWLPRVPAMGEPFLFAVALQEIAYHLAVHRGLDPDRPRSLAKSVTVE